MSKKCKKGENDLLTWCLHNGDRGQQIINEWVGTDENGNNIDIDNVSYGCWLKNNKNYKVQWKCSDCGKIFLATIKYRTSTYGNCPECYGNKCKPGKNDLYTWCLSTTNGEEILKDWTGVDDSNNKYNINEVAAGSSKILRWKCNRCKKIWDTAISNRTYKKSGCPYCKAKNQSDRNVHSFKQSLYEYAIENNKKLIEEYIGLDENNKYIDIKNIGSKSSCKIKWKCINCGNEWYSSIKHRTLNNSGCPICGRIKNRETLYDFFKLNSNKPIYKDWIGIDEHDNLIDSKLVSTGSQLRVKWKCHKCGNTWCTPIYQRTRSNRPTGCPICNRVTYYSNTYNLKTWIDNNGVFGEQLLKEWTGETDTGEHIDIDKITHGSKIKIKWICNNCMRAWYAEINERTYYKTGCPYCSVRNTSFSELLIYYSFKQIYTTIQNRYRLTNKRLDGPKTIEFDILALNNNKELNYKAIAIEYSPTYWHFDKKHISEYKRRLCDENGILFIEIIDDSYKELNRIYSLNLVQDVIEKSKNRIDKLIDIIEYIRKQINVNRSIDYKKAINDTLENYNKIKL